MVTTAQLLLSGMLLGGVYVLASVGLTLMFGVAKVVNFAHGEFLMLGMYLSFWLFQLYGIDPYLGALVVTPLFFVLGLVLYRGVMKRALVASEMTQVFTTLGLSIALQHLALMLWKGDYRTVKTGYSTAVIHLGPLFLSVNRLIAFAAAVVIIGLLLWFLTRTFVGKAIMAVAQDRRAAQLVGINLDQVFLVSFGLGIACAGLAGALMIPQYYAFPNVGGAFVMIAFVVVVLGGLGNVQGAMAGGLIVGLIDSVVGFFIPALKETAYFVLFILVLLVRPHGLFGLRGSEEEALR